MANSFSATFSKIYSKLLLKTFDEKGVMSKLVNRDYEGEIKNAGDTVYAVLYGDVTISDYTAGTDLLPQNLSLTQNSMVINQVKGYNAIIDDTEIAQSHLDLVPGWMDRAAVAMSNTVDDRLLGHAADASALYTLGSNAAPLTLTKDNIYEYFVDMRKILNASQGDTMPNRVAVIDEENEALLLKCPQFTQATAKGDQVISTGRIGSMAGFDIYMSPRLNAVSGVKNLMFFTKDAISLAFQIPENKMKTYDPPNQFGTGLKGLALYGSKLFNSKSLAVLKAAG